MENKDGRGGGMMWMMLPCLLLLGFLGFLFAGGGKLTGGGYLWPILIGGFVLLHVWMMFKGHGGHGSDTEDKAAASGQPETKDKSKHGCCH